MILTIRDNIVSDGEIHHDRVTIIYYMLLRNKNVSFLLYVALHLFRVLRNLLPPHVYEYLALSRMSFSSLGCDRTL